MNDSVVSFSQQGAIQIHVPLLCYMCVSSLPGGGGRYIAKSQTRDLLMACPTRHTTCILPRCFQKRDSAHHYDSTSRTTVFVARIDGERKMEEEEEERWRYETERTEMRTTDHALASSLTKSRRL